MNKEQQNKHKVCYYCDKPIKTKKSLTRIPSYWGYAHSRCHKAKKRYGYMACA